MSTAPNRERKVRLVTLIVALVVLPCIVVAAVVIGALWQLQTQPRMGRETGVEINGTITAPPPLEVSGPVICEEVDLVNGAYGALAVVSLGNSDPQPLDFRWRIEVEAGSVTKSHEEKTGMGANSRPRQTAFALGDYDGKMIEIPKGLSSCHVTLELISPEE